jgi:hypothetical protein
MDQVVDQDLSERIRERAYEIWVASGSRDGKTDQHWLAAEKEILSGLRSAAVGVTTEPQPREMTDEVVTAQPRRPDENDKVVKTKTRPANDEIAETGTQLSDTSTEVEQTERRPDLVWDTEPGGLCVRIYGDGSKSFIFVYRTDDRQRFLRIGKTPIWSLEAARDKAKKLRSILDQGGDPASYHERNKVAPVEHVIRYIAEHLQTKA